MVEPVIVYNSKSKYYSNSSSFSLKVLAELRRKSADWYLELKRVLTVASKIADRPTVVFDNFARSTQFMNAASEELPFAKTAESPDVRSVRLQHFLAEYIN